MMKKKKYIYSFLKILNFILFHDDGNTIQKYCLYVTELFIWKNVENVKEGNLIRKIKQKIQKKKKYKKKDYERRERILYRMSQLIFIVLLLKRKS